MSRQPFFVRLASLRVFALALGLAVLAALLVAVPLPVHAATSAATGTGGLYVPSTQRIANSTNGTGGLPNTRLVSNHWYQVPIEGAGTIPSTGVSSVQVTFTVEDQTSTGVVHADQGSATSPNTSVPYVTYDSSNSIANAAVLPVGANGNIQVQVTSQADLVVNVQGYYTSGNPAAGGFVATPAAGVFNSSTVYTQGETATFQVGGTSAVPAGASAVVLDVIESNQGTGAGYLYAYPDGTARTTALNWPAAQNYEWTTVVTLPASGKVTIFIGSSSATGVKLSAGIEGYYTANNGPAISGAFTPGTARVYNSQSPSAPIAAGATRTIQVAGVNGVPKAGSGITAAAMNVSIVSASGAQGHTPVYADDSTAGSDDVQFYPSSTTMDFATVKLGADGGIKIDNDSSGTINVVIDVEGWFSNLDTGPSTTGLTGSRPSATNLKFGISDQVQAQVDVATGNLMLTTGGLSLPGIGSKTAIGETYNSEGWLAGDSVDSAATNWTFGLDGAGSLSQNVNGVVYTAGDGSTWLFTPTVGATGVTTYQPPAGIQATLAVSAASYTLKAWDGSKTITFSLNGDPTQIQDRNHNNVQINYTNDVATSLVSDAGVTGARTATIAYDQPSTTTTVSQTSGSSSRQVQWVKDANNNLVKFVDANGATTTFGYTGSDITSITGPTGAVTTFIYSGSTHKVSEVDQQNTTAGSPGTSTTRLNYVSASETDVADPDTDSTVAVTTVKHTTYTIDGSTNLVTKAVDAAGRSRGASYNGANLGVASSTSGGDGTSSSTGSTTSTNTYGANSGQSLTQTQSPGKGASSTATYGAASANTQYSVTGTTDDAGNSSSTGYDGLGNMDSSTGGDGAQASVVLNSSGNGDGSNDGQVYSALSPNNKGTSNYTSYHYNSATRQLDSITPVTAGTGSQALGANHFTYDDFGRVASETDGNGVTVSYTYDNDDRLLTTSFSDNTGTVTDSYDAAGNKLTEVSPSGTVTNTYDQLNRLLSTQNSAGGGMETYTYDQASHQISSSDSFGTYTNSYDASGVLEVTKYPKGGSYQYIDYATDTHGRRVDEWLQGTATYAQTNTDSPTSPSSWAVQYQTAYDQTTGRVQEIKAFKGSTTTFDTIYCHSDSTVAGNTNANSCGTNPLYDRSKLQSSFNVLSAQNTVYSYDKGGRIAEVNQTGGNAGNTDWKYAYDSDGNRTKVTTNGTVTQNVAYNPADQITASGYTYDGSGNLLTATAAGGSGSATYTYNGADQMTSATVGGATTTYAYAGSSQNALLSATTAGGATVSYTYGQGGLVKYQNGSATSHIYNDPTTGQPVMLTTSGDVDALYIDDGLGNIAGLTTDDSSASVRTAYDPYGASTLNGSAAANTSTQNPYAFKNGVVDQATALVKFGARWYNTLTGTWTQRDTLDSPLDPHNANRYVFAAGDPVNGSDPSGKSDFGSYAGACAVGTVENLGIGLGLGAITGGVGLAVTAAVGCAEGIAGQVIADNAPTATPGYEYANGLSYLNTFGVQALKVFRP